MRGIDSLYGALHICTIVFVIILLTGHEFVDLSMYKAAAGSLQKGQFVDAISLSAQIGRLDLVSAMLAMIGFLVAIVGIVGYTEIRNRAIREARAAAVEYMKENLGPMVRRELENMQAFAVAAGSEPGKNEIDEIANALDDGGTK